MTFDSLRIPLQGLCAALCIGGYTHSYALGVAAYLTLMILAPAKS